MADVKAGRLFLLSNYITEDNLTSQIDGVKLSFNLSNNFYGGTTRVFLNGLRQEKGVNKDVIEEVPNKIIFSSLPEVGDNILVDYIKI